jgi:hypothetical protein
MVIEPMACGEIAIIMTTGRREDPFPFTRVIEVIIFQGLFTEAVIRD